MTDFRKMEVAVYANCKASGMYHPVALERVYEAIRGNDELRKRTEQYRELLTDKKKAQAARRMKTEQFDMMLPAAVCGNARKLEELQRYTGLCQMDLDHLGSRTDELMRRLCEIPEVLLAYRSLSGQGIHVLYAYEVPPGGVTEEYYRQAFRQGNEWLANLLVADYDPEVEPPVHGQNLCHDAEAYFNPEARLFIPDRAHPVQKRGNREHIANRKPLRQSQWPKGWTAERLFERSVRWVETSRTGAFVPGNRHAFLFQLGCLLAEWGMEEESAATLMEEAYGADYREEKYPALVASCYRHVGGNFGWRALPDEQHPGRQEVRTLQVKHFIERQGLMYDVVSRKVVRRDSEGYVSLENREVNSLIVRCCEETGENISQPVFLTVLHSDVLPAVNPLEQYVSALPSWSPGDRDYIGEVADMVHVAPTPMSDDEEPQRVAELWRHCFTKWFTAMVATWSKPRAVNHQVLTLIGKQGILKTTWVEALMPPLLRKYLTKQSIADNLTKDERSRAAEFGLINIDEIDRLSPRSLEAFKSLITTDTISLRPVYAAFTENRRRIASYVATGNKTEFLTDTSGNRRWLPFYVESIDSPYDHPLPYEGMYAQARYLVEQGFRYWFTGAETAQLERHVNTFMSVAPEKELIQVYFSPAQRGATGAVFLTLSEIQANLTIWGNLKKCVDLRTLAAYLRDLGFEQVRVGREQRRGYFVWMKSAEQVNAERRFLTQ